MYDIDKTCAFCRSNLEHRDELEYEDSFLGISYPLKMQCDWCPTCKGYVLGSNVFERNRLRRDYRTGLIVKKYPFNEENWMTLDEACLVLNKSKVKFMRYLSDGFFMLKKHGRWHVLRKSMEQFIARRDNEEVAHGLFPIND